MLQNGALASPLRVRLKTVVSLASNTAASVSPAYAVTATPFTVNETGGPRLMLPDTCRPIAEAGLR